MNNGDKIAVPHLLVRATVSIFHTPFIYGCKIDFNYFVAITQRAGAGAIKKGARCEAGPPFSARRDGFTIGN